MLLVKRQGLTRSSQLWRIQAYTDGKAPPAVHQDCRPAGGQLLGGVLPRCLASMPISLLVMLAFSDRGERAQLIPWFPYLRCCQSPGNFVLQNRRRRHLRGEAGRLCAIDSGQRPGSPHKPAMYAREQHKRSGGRIDAQLARLRPRWPGGGGVADKPPPCHAQPSRTSANPTRVYKLWLVVVPNLIHASCFYALFGVVMTNLSPRHRTDVCVTFFCPSSRDTMHSLGILTSGKGPPEWAPIGPKEV